METSSPMNGQPRPACAGLDLDIFYPPIQYEGDKAIIDEADTLIARAICKTCEVRRNCLTNAIRNRQYGETDGIMGGFTADERRKIKNQTKPRRGHIPLDLKTCDLNSITFNQLKR